MIVVFFLKFAAVLSFNEELSKTISLEQYKSMVYDAAANAEYKDDSYRKDVPKKPVSSAVAKVSGPCASSSTPRQSKTIGSTPRSARCSVARGVRGSYVKSKTGCSKHGHHLTPSRSFSLLSSQSGSCSANKVISSELCAPKLSPEREAWAASDSCKHTSVDDDLFPGSCAYH